MHLKKGRVIEGIIFPLFLSACVESTQPDSYVARVNNSYLTEKDISQIVDTADTYPGSRNELIKNWVRKEVLYQEALNEGLVKDESFNRVIENSKKELAAALLLQKKSKGNKINFTESDLKNYYEINHNSFILPVNAYYLNMASFSNQGEAIAFRSSVISGGWKSALMDYDHDSTLTKNINSLLVNEEDVYPSKILRMVKELYPPEISIVIPDDAGYYSVVQVLDKFDKGTVPPFEIIKPEVEKRYISELNLAAIQEYIEELYNQNKIEVNF